MREAKRGFVAFFPYAREGQQCHILSGEALSVIVIHQADWLVNSTFRLRLGRARAIHE